MDSNKSIDKIVRQFEKYLPGVDPSVRRSVIAVLALGIFLLLLISLPFTLGVIILAVIAYFLWKRFNS